MFRRIFLTGIFFWGGCYLFAQSDRLGSWSSVNTRVGIVKNWEVFNELQLRSQSFYSDFFYYEVKGGVAYKLNKNFQFLVGTGKYITHSIAEDGSFNKPVTSDETRLWQQLTMNHYLERIKFEHRYRVEQRWISTGYQNRFRYRLNVFVPLNKPSIEKGTVYFSAFNEIFLTNKADYFSRNRAFGGVGYQFNKMLGILPGYVYQFDFDNKNDTGHGKHFFQLNFLINIDDIEETARGIPSIMD
ncbi:MAG: DUF2490 domain-containing protein [Chitinophagaceae bacterium]|nr:DUF2490 domain-containing protein [Chitinophagaceae bacterium]MCW5927696.1 DUF2490 domain-containing protein [Chitinophagaceae bacterium]